MPAGQPTKYKPEYCEMLIEHMSGGFSLESFAGKINVSKDSLYQWAKDYKEFSDAFEVAKSKCQLFWEDTGIKGTLGKIRGFNGNTWAFWMKNRFQWHENIKTENKDVDSEEKNKTISKLASSILEAAKLANEVK